MKKNSIIYIILSLFLSLNLSAQEIPDRPYPPRLVNDFAGLLTPTENQKLETKLINYNDTTSTQIAIILMKSLGKWPISEFSFRLGDKWGVGQAGMDNGIVITIAEEERETFIATGRGSEGSVTDIHAHRIVHNLMLPEFSNGNFYAGLDKATDALIGLMAGEYISQVSSPPDNNDFPFPYLELIIILFAVIILPAIVSYFSDGDGGGSISSGGWRGPVVASRPRGHSGSFGGGGGGFGGFGGGSFGGGGAGGKW